MAMIDAYNGWLQLLKDNNCTDAFRNELQKEGGRRYTGCLVKNSLSLCREDFKAFLDYAEKEKAPLVYAESKEKMKIVKSVVTLFGVKK